MTTHRLVIEVPICTCLGCGAQAEGIVYYVQPDAIGSVGGVSVNMIPPPSWVELESRGRLPDGVRDRRFTVCGSCYEKGAPYGDARARATFEAVPA